MYMANQCQKNNLIQEGIVIVNKLFNSFVHTHRLKAFLSKEDLEDMKQDCYVEMIEVVNNKFKPCKGYKLSTYLTPRITGFMKDHIGNILKRQEPDNEFAIEIFASKIRSMVDLPQQQISLEVEKLGLTNCQIEDLMLDLSRYENGYEIVESLAKLPEACLTVILGYYILRQSIQELSVQYGFSSEAGWLYKIKREGIEMLKRTLKEKGVL